LLFSFISYLFTGTQDQSVLQELGARTTPTKNWISQLGAWLGDVFIYKGFGIPAFSIAILTIISGIFLFASGNSAFSLSRKRISNLWFWGLLLLVWTSVFFGFFHKTNTLLGGKVGYELNDFLQDYLGLLGAILVMVFIAIVYLVLRLQLTPERISAYFSKKASEVKEGFEDIETTDEESDWKKATLEGSSEDADDTEGAPESSIDLLESPMEISIPEEEVASEPVLKKTVAPKDENDIGMEIEQIIDEEEMIDSKASKLVEDFG
jgi:S-DNA-T family DNA segregation ATPase FtsK/SpoIIIE